MLLDPNILATFDALLTAARAGADPEPTAMALATAGADGRISVRQVLLKAHDERGFVFYTHATSRKGRQLAESSRAALNFYWRHLPTASQVRVEGDVEFVADVEADAYFATRPRDSQIGAWASDQSQPMESPELFAALIAEVEERFEGMPVPRPPAWRGYRLRPDLIEFWYAQVHRLHRRDSFEWHDGRWVHRLLYP